MIRYIGASPVTYNFFKGKMMKLTGYKLSQYKIIQNDFDDIWWELHTAFGEIKRGKCFIKGDILILDAGKFEEAGFLMLEYHGNLSRLPTWKKTKYYCINPTIYSCKNHKKVAISKISATQRRRKRNRTEVDTRTASQNVSFQLGNYEIIVKKDGTAKWRKFVGYAGIKGGDCFINGDILFIIPDEIEKNECLKKDFNDYLNQLPQWNRTEFFCRHAFLHLCLTETGKRNKYHTNFLGKKSISDRIWSGQTKSMKQDLKLTDDKGQMINSSIKLINSIIIVICAIVEFIFNFFIELIGIRKK